jgi:hypothetical protein
MSKEQPLDGEQPRKIEIFFELSPSPQGTYQYEREDGSVVHGDASGEWTLDENGDAEDIVFFASPLFLGYGRKVAREDNQPPPPPPPTPTHGAKN